MIIRYSDKHMMEKPTCVGEMAVHIIEHQKYNIPVAQQDPAFRQFNLAFLTSSTQTTKLKQHPSSKYIF
jgi:hypothetical protein